MADIKACDLHPNKETRNHSKEETKTVQLEQWMKVGGKNKLFVLRLDGCNECINELLLQRAKALGTNVESLWRTEVWQTGQSGKKYTTMMGMDEYLAYVTKEAQDRELAELRALKAQVGK